MRIKRDQITGAVLVILGIVLMVLISQFKKPITAEYPGPKLMPGIAAIGLIICGLGVFVRGCRQKGADRKIISGKGLLRMLITFAALLLYIPAMKYFGFLLATPFLVFGLTWYFSKASGVSLKPWIVIVFAVAVTAVIWGMYVPLFGMELPVGSLFE